ncbi:tetratricopeptide repeat protein [Orrella sp. JC864]|uniref:tetratricopeptide repeat protein n=1 Tax=Orrella sp. JC864 TaxID=3120298 RepID=UPI00300AD943
MQPLIDRLQAMLAQGQDNLLLRFSLGKGYAEQGRPEKAREHLEAAVAFDPEHSAAWKWLGRACLELGDVPGARRAWQAGLAASERRGDVQAGKEMRVFLKRLDKRQGQEPAS